MRVLLVGNYDIAGKYIAERLYKEGHNISWHTEEEKLELWDASIKGTVYRHEINYKSSSHIIKTESPECIIFLTQNYRDAYDWTEDELFRMEDFELEVLRAAASLCVKKILYLSSKELSLEEVLNPAMEKLRGTERLCQAVCKENHMDCLIVRTGIIYGEGSYINQGFVDGVLHAILKNKKIATRYTPEAELDFIYGKDFADAIERLLATGETGTYTVASGYPVTCQEFYHLALEASGCHLVIQYGLLDHKEQMADGLQLKYETGWMPFYMFADRMPIVLKHYVILYRKTHPELSIQKKKREYKFLKDMLQNFAAFLLFMLLDYFSTDLSDFRFVDVKLLYVVVVSISFGMKQGMIATILAIGVYFAKIHTAGVDLSYIFYSMETWVPFLIYGIAGAVVGYISDKKNDDMENCEEEYQTLHKKYTFLKSMYQEVLKIKNQLQKQIMISKDSLAHVYEITEALDDIRPRTVMLRAVKVIEETMECSGVAIFTKDSMSSYGRMTACSGNLLSELPGSIRFSDFPRMEEVLLRGELFINTDLLENYPSFAMPILDGNEIAAVVMLYCFSPENYTIYYKNLFQTLLLILRNCLLRAYRHQEETREKSYVPGTDLLQEWELKAELDSLLQVREELQYPFCIGQITYDSNLSWQEAAKRVTELIRTTDIAGKTEDDKIRIILLFVEPSMHVYIEQRFEKAGLHIVWEDAL